MKIFIDWKEVTTEGDFYNSMLSQLEAPDWHGRNLDALADSLINGDINGIEPPFCIINLNVSAISEQMQGFSDKVAKIYVEANEQGRKIRVFEE